MECYISQSCWKGSICQNKSSAYICECPEGFFDGNCETDVYKCSSKLCQNDADNTHIPNVSLNLRK